MNLFGISSVLLFFASIGFGISLYESDKKSPVSKSWLLASFSIAFWGLGLFILTSNTNKDIAIWGEHLIDVSSAFIPIAYFIFAQKLVGTDYKKINKFGLTVACGIAILSFTSLYKIGISDEKFGFFWIEPGPYYFIFPVYFVIFIVGAILILVKKYTHTNSHLK